MLSAKLGGSMAWTQHLDWYDGLDEIINKPKEEELWLREQPVPQR